jgi:hypothetical protein
MPTPTRAAIRPLAIQLFRSRSARQITKHAENARKMKYSVFMGKEMIVMVKK